MNSKQRTTQPLKEHYEIEKELANRLRETSRDERKTLYASLYDEFTRRVPFYAELTQKHSSQEIGGLNSPQWQFLRRFLHNETVFLEVGAGVCTTSIVVARFVKKVYALEVSEEITKQVKGPENFELILFDGFSIPLPPESVDVAYSDQVMEHIHPDDALEQLINIHELLRSQGIYICVTPNRLNGPHDISRYFDVVATGFHLKEYTNTELSHIFKQAGFSKVRAYIGVPGVYVRFPLFLLKIQEGLLSHLPPKLSRAIASVSLSWCIRLVGIKE